MWYDPRLARQPFAADTKVIDPRAAPAPIAELDRITLVRDVEGDDGDMVPAGSTGTVVGIWAGGAAFEVEFARPFSALATVAAEAIGAHFPRA